MYQTISFWAPRVPDYLPESIRQRTGLLDLSTALQQVHFPDNAEQLDAARARLAFDEIFLLQLGVLRQKRSWESVSGSSLHLPEDWLDAQVQRLPYTLTGAQQHALQDVCT